MQHQLSICLFLFWFFGREACGIRPGMEPAPPALEGEVLAIGLPGKSLGQGPLFFFFFLWAHPNCPEEVVGTQEVSVG